MEQKIDDFKKLYLGTTPRMGADEGLEDVFARLDRPKTTPLRPFLYGVSAFTVIILALTAAILLFPENKTVSGIKAATQNIINQLISPTPSVTKTPVLNIKKVPLLTPTPTKAMPSVTPPKSKPSIPPGRIISGDRKSVSPTKSVQGISTQKPPTNQSQNSNNTSEKSKGDVNRSQNSENNNSQQNPSSEKSQKKN